MQGSLEMCCRETEDQSLHHHRQLVKVPCVKAPLHLSPGGSHVHVYHVILRWVEDIKGLLFTLKISDNNTLLQPARVCYPYCHWLHLAIALYTAPPPPPSLAGQTNFSPPPGEKYVWSSAYSVLVQMRRNAGAFFFSN